jgi:hypothetical protein
MLVKQLHAGGHAVRIGLAQELAAEAVQCPDRHVVDMRGSHLDAVEASELVLAASGGARHTRGDRIRSVRGSGMGHVEGLSTGLAVRAVSRCSLLPSARSSSKWDPGGSSWASSVRARWLALSAFLPP